jgi:phage terminase small subunit
MLKKSPEPGPVKMDPPEAPDWLSPTAGEVWNETSRLMIVERTWRQVFASTLAVYSTLYSQFTETPDTFSATKLVQLRLLAGDLGLSPATISNVARVSIR